MWNLNFTPPVIIEAREFTRLPSQFRKAVRSEWADANKGGEAIDSFLEGPCFDRAGTLYVTDIPHGRIFKIESSVTWHEVANTGGWPNGMAVHRDGGIWITDYKRGILRLNPADGRIDTLLGHRNTESFKGVNDRMFDANGNCYFTDQGQTGMHNPSGSVYRLRVNGQLDLLLNNAPSPNGIAVDPQGKWLFVAVTRGNAVWRGPIQPDGSLTKVGVFQQFFGTSGPDGLALDNEKRLVVAHPSLGGAFVLNASGEVSHFVRCPDGPHGPANITNIAFRPGSNQLVLTDSGNGIIFEASLPAHGLPLYSHS